MIPFAFHTVERLRGVLVVDEGNTERIDWETPDTEVISGANVQPIGTGAATTERETADRNTLIDRWVLYAPPTADIRFEDRIRYKGAVYHVDGEPKMWPNPIDGSDAYQEVRLRRDRG